MDVAGRNHDPRKTTRLTTSFAFHHVGRDPLPNNTSLSSPIVDPSGVAYLEFNVRNAIGNDSFSCSNETWTETTNGITSTTTSLLSVGSDNSISTIGIKSDNSTTTVNRKEDRGQRFVDTVSEVIGDPREQVAPASGQWASTAQPA